MKALTSWRCISSSDYLLFVIFSGSRAVPRSGCWDSYEHAVPRFAEGEFSFQTKRGTGDAKYSRSVFSLAKSGKLFVSFEHSFRINSFLQQPYVALKVIKPILENAGTHLID